MTTYQGYTNAKTWAVCLAISNERELYQQYADSRELVKGWLADPVKRNKPHSAPFRLGLVNLTPFSSMAIAGWESRRRKDNEIRETLNNAMVIDRKAQTSITVRLSETFRRQAAAAGRKIAPWSDGKGHIEWPEVIAEMLTD